MVYYINYWLNRTVVHSGVVHSRINYFPCQRVDASMSTDVGAAEETEARELVHFVTQQTRFMLLNNILQHPDQLPSMYELEQLNPSISDATVYKHIQKLIDAGMVEEAALPDDERRQGYPWKFYGVSDAGREFLDEHNLLEAEETLQRIYETISDKPEKMIKYENAPRPH
jgi:DNA-binding MarR family transcriptional regulator